MKQEVITTLDAALGTAAGLCRYAMLTKFNWRRFKRSPL
jgi:hypothetical protein